MECGQAGKTNAHDSQAWLRATPGGTGATGAGTGQQPAELPCLSSGGPTLHSLADLHTWSNTVYQVTDQAVCTAEKEMGCRDSHTQLVGTWHSPHSLGSPVLCVCRTHRTESQPGCEAVPPTSRETAPPAAGETAGRSWVNVAKDTCRVGQSA